MKQRGDSVQMLLEANVKACIPDATPATAVANGGCPDVTAEVQQEGRRNSGEFMFPSRTLSHWGSDIPMAVKSQEKSKKRMKVEKKAGTGAKAENRKTSTVRAEIQKSHQSAVRSSSGRTTPDSVTPLQSIEGSYIGEPLLQHQNKIFVFSTRLANEAAESVKCGHCKSIIHYHVEHPNTKQFLQSCNNYGCSLPPAAVGVMKGHQMPEMIPMNGSSSANWQPHMPEMHDPRLFDRNRMLPDGPYLSDPRAINGCPSESPRGTHPHAQFPMNCRECFHNSIDANNDLMLGCSHNSSDKFSVHVPDENLTLEQKQHRSKGLAQLTKIHQMLMGDGSLHDGRQVYMDQPPASGMYSCRPRLMGLPHQPAMMPHGGMMHARGMLAPHHQHMMMNSTHGCCPGKPPFEMSGKGQQSPHEWYQVQRELLERQQCPQNRGAHMEPGPPPPPYYSSISHKQSAVSEPSSPNMTGMRILTHPDGSRTFMVPGMDPYGTDMYGGPAMFRPSHLQVDPMSRMHDYHSHDMLTHRPMLFECDSMLEREIQPGMGHGPLSPDNSRTLRSVHKGHTEDYNEMLPEVPDEVTLHRAGNPEHFNPETMGGVVTPITTPSSNSRKPPSYAQAQKRKRDEDKDDFYAKGNLQRTPSPTKIDYHLSQFEGQELTITKQLNSSFIDNKTGNCTSEDDGCSSLVSGNSEYTLTGIANSPSAALRSNEGSHANLHQVTGNITRSPTMLTSRPNHHQSQEELANTNCTSFSSSAFNCVTNINQSQRDSTDVNNGVSTAPHTPVEKPSSMTNITSATLANLAKGVETLSSQMEQSMMEGGPFRSLQVHGDTAGNGSSSNTRSNSSGGSANMYSTSAETSSYLSPQTGATTSPQSSSMQNMNNTYMSTHTSLPNHISMNSYVDIQGQDISSESAHTNIQRTTELHLESETQRECPAPRNSHHTNHLQDATNSTVPMPSGSVDLGPPTSSELNPTRMFSPHQLSSSSCVLETPPLLLPKVQFTSSPLSNSHMSGTGSRAAPGTTSPYLMNPSSCNSNVQIQQKGHNTIQYLPAKPPSSQPSAVIPKCDFEHKTPEFLSLMHTMDGKHSPSPQYFTNSSPAGSRSPMMSRNLLAATTLGSEFANQAAFAMHQSASMMRSSSLPDLDTVNRNHPNAPPPKTGPMMSVNSLSQVPHMSGNNPHMVGPDPLMEMGNLYHMKSRSSPRSVLSLPQGMVPGNLECISPIPDMGDCLSAGPSIEEAQAQAQAHAAMMMQGNIQMSASSPHGHIIPRGGPSPHMPVIGSMSGISMHGPMPHQGIPVSSALGSLMLGQCSYRPPPQSSHADMHRFMPGFPNEPMPNSIRNMFPYESVHRLSPQSFASGPLPPHMSMGYMQGLMSSSSLYRHPGMGHLSGQYGIHYPGYQEDFYYPGPLQDHPSQMSGMMGGPRQPF